MKKNFLAKLGHFFLVSAVLFNTFGGILLVKAVGLTADFTSSSDGIVEGEIGEISPYEIPVQYNGPTLEGEDTYSVTINIGGPVGGNNVATLGVDFDVPDSVDNSYTIVFSSSTESIQYIPVKVIGNDTLDGDKVAAFKITEGQLSSLFLLTLAEDDYPEVTYTLNNVKEKDADKSAQLLTTLTNKSSDQITVFVHAIPGSAGFEDFQMVSFDGYVPPTVDGYYELDENRLEGGSDFSVYVQPLQDDIEEGDETFQVQVLWMKNNRTNEDITFANGDTTFTYDVTIKDDETILTDNTKAPEFIAGSNPTEGASWVGIAQIKNNTTSDLTYTINLSGDATLSEDYDLSIGDVDAVDTSFDVNIPAETTKNISLSSLHHDDTINEGDESVIFSVTNATDSEGNDYVFDEVSYTGKIIDNDSSSEGSSNNNPTVVGAGIPDMEVVGTYGDMISSTTLASYFTDVDGDSLTFTATSSDTSNITAVMDNGDLVILSSNTNLTQTNVTVTADDGNGGTVEDTFVVSVIGNEVSFDISDDSVSEDDGSYLVHLHSLKPAKDSGAGAPEGQIGNSTVRAYIKVGPTSTVTDADYIISAPTSTSEIGTLYMVEIPVGTTSTSFEVSINDDEIKEANEWLYLSLVIGNGSFYVNADADNFNLLITDNDNSYPEVTQIAEQDLLVGQSIDIDLDDYISDPDEDILTFTNVSAQESSIISLEFDSETHVLTISGLSEGYSKVGFTATDPYNAGVNVLFGVLVSASEENNGNGNTDTTAPSSSNGGGGSLLPNTAPEASLTTGQEVTIAVNTEVTFDASGSIDKEGNIRFYFWNFGDGSDEVYYTVPTTTHTYTEVGTYTLSIKVKDSYGEESSAEVTVNVVKGNEETTTDNTDSTGTTTDNNETGTTTDNTDNTETTTTKPVEETTGNTGTTTSPVTEENTSENTNTEETPVNNEEETTNEENNNTTENTEEVEQPSNEENQNLPTWIKIIFGSGALAAIAGAGIAINRVRKNV